MPGDMAVPSPPQDFMKKNKKREQETKHGSLISKVARLHHAFWFDRAIFNFSAREAAMWHGLPVPYGTTVPHEKSAKTAKFLLLPRSSPFNLFPLSLQPQQTLSLPHYYPLKSSLKTLKFSQIFPNFFNSFTSFHFPLKISHHFTQIHPSPQPTFSL